MESAERLVGDMEKGMQLGEKGRGWEEGEGRSGRGKYITYALLVNGYAKSNHAEKAIEAMQKMEQLGISVGPEVVDSIISVLIRKVICVSVE